MYLRRECVICAEYSVLRIGNNQLNTRGAWYCRHENLFKVLFPGGVYAVMIYAQSNSLQKISHSAIYLRPLLNYA